MGPRFKFPECGYMGIDCNPHQPTGSQEFTGEASINLDITLDRLSQWIKQEARDPGSGMDKIFSFYILTEEHTRAR